MQIKKMLWSIFLLSFLFIASSSSFCADEVEIVNLKFCVDNTDCNVLRDVHVGERGTIRFTIVNSHQDNTISYFVTDDDQLIEMGGPYELNIALNNQITRYIPNYTFNSEGQHIIKVTATIARTNVTLNPSLNINVLPALEGIQINNFSSLPNELNLNCLLHVNCDIVGQGNNLFCVTFYRRQDIPGSQWQRIEGSRRLIDHSPYHYNYNQPANELSTGRFLFKAQIVDVNQRIIAQSQEREVTIGLPPPLIGPLSITLEGVVPATPPLHIRCRINGPEGDNLGYKIKAFYRPLPAGNWTYIDRSEQPIDRFPYTYDISRERFNAGRYSFKIQAFDSNNNLLSESQEQGIGVVVTPPPLPDNETDNENFDIQPVDGSLTFIQGNNPQDRLSADMPITVNFRIRNNSRDAEIMNIPTLRYRIQFFKDGRLFRNTVSSCSVSNLSVGQEQTVSCNIGRIAENGQYRVRLKLDPDHRLEQESEQNRQNNEIGPVSITIGAHILDLEILENSLQISTPNYIETQRVNRGEDIRIHFRVRNGTYNDIIDLPYRITISAQGTDRYTGTFHYNNLLRLSTEEIVSPSIPTGQLPSDISTFTVTVQLIPDPNQGQLLNAQACLRSKEFILVIPELRAGDVIIDEFYVINKDTGEKIPDGSKVSKNITCEFIISLTNNRSFETPLLRVVLRNLESGRDISNPRNLILQPQERKHLVRFRFRTQRWVSRHQALVFTADDMQQIAVSDNIITLLPVLSQGPGLKETPGRR